MPYFKSNLVEGVTSKGLKRFNTNMTDDMDYKSSDDDSNLDWKKMN